MRGRLIQVLSEELPHCSILSDELCIAAAFCGATTLYGVSAGGLKTAPNPVDDRPTMQEIRHMVHAAENLRERVKRLVREMERKDLLLVEPGGEVLMQETLYHTVMCMGNAERLGRMVLSQDGRTVSIYLYRYEEALTVMLPNDRGRTELFYCEAAEQWKAFGAKLPLAPDHETAVTALVFRRGNDLYHRLRDTAWRGTGFPGELWDDACGCLLAEEEETQE